MRLPLLFPAAVSILIGINDIGVAKNTGKSLRAQEFAYNYDTLIRRLLEASISSVFLLSPFVFSRPQEYLNWLPEVREVENTIEALARQYQLPFLPLQERMQESEKQYGTEMLTPDGIHLTPFGHELLAKWWLEAFADLY
ncbi:MAG: SGNH/GDSL hydrolase family protein [Blautia sp.]